MTIAQKGGVPEISEAAKAKMQSLIEATPYEKWGRGAAEYALARFIQEVSDAAEPIAALIDREINLTDREEERVDALKAFILPEPVDPLVEILRPLTGRQVQINDEEWFAKTLREALAESGLKIVEASA